MKLTVIFISVALALILVREFRSHPSEFGYEYVPADNFKSVVTVSAQSEAKVGEWVPLTAVRDNGPWTIKKKNGVIEGPRVFFDFVPPVHESGVSGSLSWDTDPPGHARFDLPQPGDSCRAPRKVKFDAAGVYKIKGYSSFPAIVSSNTITINVSGR